MTSYVDKPHTTPSTEEEEEEEDGYNKISLSSRRHWIVAVVHHPLLCIVFEGETEKRRLGVGAEVYDRYLVKARGHGHFGKSAAIHKTHPSYV